MAHTRLDRLERSLHRRLGAKFRGKIVALEPKSGRYFLGSSVMEALKKARNVFKDESLYFLRLRYPFVYQRHGVRPE